MKFYSKSDIGLIRNTNQDSFYVDYLNETSVFAVVCDGMGGANGGNIASKLAVESIKEYILKTNTQTKNNGVSIKDFLIDAAKYANEIIFKKSKESAQLAGMGTTIVLTIITNGKAYVVHAGDSRAYILNKETITQITTDHSIVQEMIKSGEITKEQAMNHPQKNIITRALGINSNIELDYNEVPFNKEDTILVCTDGLTNYVNENNIKSFLSDDLKDFSNKLIDEAKKLGGSDNITVVAVGN